MADRTDFFFRQRITEVEIDQAFDLMEKADRNLASDLGIYGIISGAEPVEHEPVADLSIDLVAPARAYDRRGQRIHFGTDQNVDCSADHNGIPTEVATEGNERWLGVFLRFARLLSDPRTDGHSQEVFFRRDEHFEVVVRQAAEAASGSTSKVPVVENELLICDVRLTFGQTQIRQADIDVSRRQAFIFAQGRAVEVVSGLWQVLKPAADTVQAALDEIDGQFQAHLASTAARHRAAEIAYRPRDHVKATDVQGALDQVVDNLANTQDDSCGAELVGVQGIQGKPHGLSAGSLLSHIESLLRWLNEHLASTARAHGSQNIVGTEVRGEPQVLAAGTLGEQLTQLLALINEHLKDNSAAHAAEAVEAAAHHHISAGSVQGQLVQIIEALAAQEPSLGAATVGSAAIEGKPKDLTMGTLRQQLAELLGHLNAHLESADHDGRYYTKNAADGRYYNVGEKVADADKLDGQHADDFALAGHVHDDRYFTCTQVQSAYLPPMTSSKRLAKLVSLPDLVTVSHFNADRPPRQITYFYGGESAPKSIACWVVKATDADTVGYSYELFVNNPFEYGAIVDVGCFRHGR